MPDVINKPNEDNLISSLDDVSLDGVHNPVEPTTNTLPSTGNPAQPQPTPPVEPTNPVQPTPPVEPVNEPAVDFKIKSFDDLTTLLTTKTVDQLSEEENSELSDIIEAFGGKAFNDKGEIIDENKKVLFTAEQLKEYLETNELPVDEDGNFVDAEGNIVKSKIELYREGTTIGTVMNALGRNFELTFAENYMPEDTEDSLIDVVNKVITFREQGSINRYMQANPEVESFVKHLQLHGSSKGFNSTTIDYSKIDLKTLSKEAKMIYVNDAYTASGRTLTSTYSAYLGSLDEEAFNTEVADNIKVLKDIQTNKQKEVDTQLKAQQEQKEREAQQYWDTVETTIKNGKISNINIPLPERDAFLAYVTTPVQDGKTKDMLDAEKEDINADLLMSFLRFKGYDLSVLAKNIATTQQVQTLRDKMGKNNRRNISNSGKGQKPTTQNNSYIPSMGEVNF